MRAEMGTIIASAPSTGHEPLQRGRWRRIGSRVEAFLDAERDQLALWLPVALGGGIAAWFILDNPAQWTAWLLGMAAIAFLAGVFPGSSRMRRVVLVAAIASAIGCGAIWARALWVAGPVLSRPMVASFTGQIERVEIQTAKNRVRLTLAPINAPDLPPRVRVTVDDVIASAGLVRGDKVSLRARLVGPPTASVPGGFDFSRVAWFQGLGATGKAIGLVTRVGSPSTAGASMRDRLSAHIRSQLEGSAGGIASAFATGDRGGISPEDEEAMRASGLTHLLSVSGLHVTAVVGATIFLSLRLLALSSFLALRLPLLLISALIGALAGIGYTLLTGAEVPTVRSCVAAVLVLAGIALGREAFTLRLVATGAIIILLLWPEALVGPSFQLSFAAITSIVALHETPVMRRLSAKGEEGWLGRFGRAVLGLLITGIVVEAALAPIALFHFHKSGLYGALANIVAIPLTTFVIMPLEALALLFDSIGLGAPFWWLTGLSLDILLWLSRSVAAVPGAQAALASVPVAAFGLIIGGGLWLMLWHGRVRLWGVLPVITGALSALLAPPPDLLITGDGMHLAVRSDGGTLSTLRPRAGEYVRSVLSERAGMIGELSDMDALPGADCSTDTCRVTLNRNGRSWRVLATRSRYMLPYAQLRAECAVADIVVSDRGLPDWCRPRWFKADRALLAKTGGIAVTLASGRVETVAERIGGHPWVEARSYRDRAKQ
jgi:competence protein ComEC